MKYHMSLANKHFSSFTLSLETLVWVGVSVCVCVCLHLMYLLWMFVSKSYLVLVFLRAHLVVQLLVEIGDEVLILGLLLIAQRGGGRGQRLDSGRGLAAATLALLVAQLLLHRHSLT